MFLVGVEKQETIESITGVLVGKLKDTGTGVVVGVDALELLVTDETLSEFSNT